MPDKKTVGIVTVYRTENCGSYLQAYVLMEILRQNGYEVKFIKYNNILSQLHSHIDISIKKILKMKFKGAVLDLQKLLNFKKHRRTFHIVSIRAAIKEHFDNIVIGSDTIWNIEAFLFYKNIERYFGNIFTSNGIRTITYAASVGNTKKELFVSNSKVREGLQKLDAVSVRDSYTQELVKDVLGEYPVKVCDPTLLWSQEEYNLLIKDKRIIGDAPILLYYFGPVSDVLKKRILELGKTTGKKIVSFGEYRAWCDYAVPYDPYTFLQYYRDSSFVITNTFHGTVFSLIYQKNFVDYGIGKQKVKDILYSVDLKERLVSDDTYLIAFYNKKITYSLVEKKINEIRDMSLKYLMGSLI